MMRILLLASAAVTLSLAVPVSGAESLISAASRGDARAVRTLLAERADVNATDADGTTALHNAVWAGELEIVDTLLRAGAKAAVANAFGVTPAYIAAEQGNAEILRRLLDAGADANLADGSGDPLLMAAVRARAVGAVRLLVERGDLV